jgi:periplasmic protein TonB
MASRALVLKEGTAPVRDRLLMTIFVAAVLHGIVILGITFSAVGAPSDPTPGLEVLLVSDELPTADRNPTATYLAQRTQLGSGNARAAAPRNRASVRSLVGHEGTLDGASLAAAGTARGAAADRVLATVTSQPDILYLSDSGQEHADAQRPLLVPERTGDEGPQDETGPVQLRGPQRDELWISPDTREATQAPYIDAWRRRIERIGTLNFPAAARNAPAASPVLEVAIAADGKIQTAEIRHSSGDPALDAAALAILKLASPFDPFPPELAAQARVIHVVYEWQFVGGQLQAGAVFAAP